jgi:hypothetical protein
MLFSNLAFFTEDAIFFWLDQEKSGALFDELDWN